MRLDIRRIDAVLFDYGNTLIRFSRPEVDACDAALARGLEMMFGAVDRARLKQIRDADRVAPYQNGLRERDVPEMTTRMVRALFGVTPDADQVAALVRARFDAVVEAIAAPAYLHGLLAEIGRTRPMGSFRTTPMPRRSARACSGWTWRASSGASSSRPTSGG